MKPNQPAERFGALPAGEYDAVILDGRLAQSRNGTPSYKLTLRVTSGDFAGRRIWYNVWLTEAALPITGGALVELGLTDLEQLPSLPVKGIRCRVRLTQWKGDNGKTYNAVQSFEVIAKDPREADPPAQGEAA
jgi:hypothetical protein